MTYSFASELYSKIATLDKDTLAAMLFGLLLGGVIQRLSATVLRGFVV